MAAYEYETHEYDVVVVGAGGAGLRATLGIIIIIYQCAQLPQLEMNLFPIVSVCKCRKCPM